MRLLQEMERQGLLKRQQLNGRQWYVLPPDAAPSAPQARRRAAMPRPKSPESPVHRARTTATLPPRSVRALGAPESQLAAMSRSRSEV